jgi:hypothetical protein
MILLFLLSKPLFNVMNSLLLMIDESMGSNVYSSRVVLSLVGRLYAETCCAICLGSDFGDNGGEASD